MSNTLAIVIILVSLSVFAAQAFEGSAQIPTGSPMEPAVDWGKCAKMAPTAEQRKQKSEIAKSCFEANPPPTKPEDLTAENVDKHRMKLGECALAKEGWFNADKTYKFDRAELELKQKDIEKSLKNRMLEDHKVCVRQALEKFSRTVMDQVHFYQSCMDFHVAQTCGIKIMIPQQQ